MKKITDETAWKKLLESDPELKELAVKAGIEDDFKRASELEGCVEWNGGKDVIKSEAEEEFAIYVTFGLSDEKETNEMFQQRAEAARRAGISVNDL